MLNILQTGDLHLGKILYEFSLIEDQRHVLNQLLTELRSFNYDALIISGDIYDRAIPSPEAVRLFDDFLTNLYTEFSHIAVCIISGNHDSNTRLAYASNFLKLKNIFITTDAEECITPIHLTSSSGDQAYVYQIPFLQVGSLKSQNGDFLKTQNDLVTEAVTRILKAHSDSQKDVQSQHIPALLNCHAFTLKGATSDSERLFLGNAELINPELFSSFLYTAIGHLHKKQKVTDAAYYSGSPLAYSFSEVQTEKVFLRIELDTKKTQKAIITPIAITPLRKLVQVEARFEDFEKMLEHKDNFIEFTCINDVPIENIANRLRKTFPYLLSIKQRSITSMYENEEASMLKKRELFEKKEALPVKAIFSSFLQSMGLLSENEDDVSTSEWNDCIPLFEEIAKRTEAEKHETN